MPIYCNAIRIARNSEAQLRREVAKWITEKMGGAYRITPDRLFSPEAGGRSGRNEVKIVAAGEREPTTISISFSQPDRDAAGRRWETQMGIQIDQDAILFTLMLDHHDTSAKVTADHPPTTTVPGIVDLIARRCELIPGTTGRAVKDLTSTSEENLTALQHHLEDRSRRYPVIIASADLEGKYATNLDTLQGKLVGLAEIIRIPPDADTFAIADKLGKRLTPYRGAIVIIRPVSSKRSANESTYLLTPERLAELKDNQNDRVNGVNSHIVERVVFGANLTRAMEHITPAAVRLKQQRDSRLALRETMDADLARIMANLGKASESDNAAALKYQSEIENLRKQYLAEQEMAEQEMADLRARLEDLRNDLLVANQLLVEASQEAEESTAARRNAEAQLENMKVALTEARRSGEGVDPTTRYALQDIITGGIEDNKKLTPEKCLHLIGDAFHERVVILPEAYTSASAASAYKKPEVLLNLLGRLVTTYVDKLNSGGDNVARSVFTANEYAANESDTVKNISDLRKHREVTYKGETIALERHLKNGARNETATSIRVYFHWDADDQKIVIGYCGAHMPTAMRHK